MEYNSDWETPAHKRGCHNCSNQFNCDECSRSEDERTDLWKPNFKKQEG